MALSLRPLCAAGACFAGLILNRAPLPAANAEQAGPPAGALAAPPDTVLPAPLLPSLRVLGPVPVKGLTIGPIESALHPDLGYASAAYETTLANSRSLGANWIALTVFGRIASLQSTDISLSFEQPFRQNRQAVKQAVRLAHANGLRVLLVPHLWVESGGWRGELAPSDDAWQAWAQAYQRFLLTWADVAQESQVDLFSVGVELRSWVTSAHAGSFVPIIERVRGVYSGPLTYAANWDDVEETSILGHLDVIGVNAFFPLTQVANARFNRLQQGAQKVQQSMQALHERWGKPILFTEVGYTHRKDPALRPWEWPDGMKNVETSPLGQAEAFAALLAAMINEPWFAGFFVWRVYSDPFDSSQEAEWGFSPLYRDAELVVRDVFSTRWWGGRVGAETLGSETSPSAFLSVRSSGLSKF